MLLGWCLWEWPDVFVEAEFHAVWEMKGGVLRDLTPNIPQEPKIRFVHDQTATIPEDYSYPSNILEPLSEDQLVLDFVEALRVKNSAESKGDMRAYQAAMAAEKPLYAKVSEKYGEEPRLEIIAKAMMA